MQGETGQLRSPVRRGPSVFRRLRLRETGIVPEDGSALIELEGVASGGTETASSTSMADVLNKLILSGNVD